MGREVGGPARTKPPFMHFAARWAAQLARQAWALVQQTSTRNIGADGYGESRRSLRTYYHREDSYTRGHFLVSCANADSEACRHTFEYDPVDCDTVVQGFIRVATG